MTLEQRQERLRKAIATWVPGENGGEVHFGTKDGKSAVQFYIPYGTNILVTNETEELAAIEAEAVLRELMDATIAEADAAQVQRRELRVAVREILGEEG